MDALQSDDANIHVRIAHEPDWEQVAEVRSSESPDYPTTIADLSYDAARRAPEERYEMFVAARGADQRALGTAWVGDEELAPHPERLRFDIRVRPEVQGQGIGKALYAAVLVRARGMGARSIQTAVSADLPRPARFLTDRGFVETWRRLDSSLDVTRFDDRKWADLDVRLAAEGIVVRTYAELADDPSCLQRLHALDTQLWVDVPYGDPVKRPALAQFKRDLLDNPDFLPDAYFVALARDGSYVGLSYLTTGTGYLNTEMTGVLGAFRGRGIAQLLKLRGILYARANGVAELQTVNDWVNEPMLRLNRKLGFVSTGTTVRYRRALDQT